MRRSHKFVTALCAIITGIGITLTTHVSAAAAADPVGLTSGFLVDPGSVPNTWVNSHAADARAAAIKANIGDYPDACGVHSGGGAGTAAAYRTWIAAFASANLINGT